MSVTVLDRAVVTVDSERMVDREFKRPDPEVPERARRRTFTAKYKLEVLTAYDEAAAGEKGAILRREGPAGLVRKSPVLGDEPAMPAQEGSRSNQTVTVQVLR